MTVDPPWRLDPHQNIVGVGWGGGKVLVLANDYGADALPWRFNLLGDDHDLDVTASQSDESGNTV